MAALDYEKAAVTLKDLFTEAEQYFQEGTVPPVSAVIAKTADTIFSSATQAYREVLLGCGLARMLDHSINIRHPYVNQGSDAFNGRTLDERVVNPFLHDRMIPCSKGPYLSAFRRNVQLVPETARGLRDKEGYTAFLDYLSALEQADAAKSRSLVLYLLFRFVVLRDVSNISLSRIHRLSLEQYEILIGKLLHSQSGGLIPVLLAVAMLRTLKSCFGLSWEIEWQGINVSDKASGVGGDITVKHDGDVVLAIEVTERPIEKARVVSTFSTKIARAGIADYLFVYAKSSPTDDARQAARTYFSQGHEINFLQVQYWIINNLATIGAKCRELFTQEILGLLSSKDVPAAVKVAWNDVVRETIGA